MNPYELDWDIRREGRRWSGPEVRRKYDGSPEKIELIEGKVLCSDEDRLAMLALLLENVGIDAAVRFGDPNLWRQAIADLDK